MMTIFRLEDWHAVLKERMRHAIDATDFCVLQSMCILVIVAGSPLEYLIKTKLVGGRYMFLKRNNDLGLLPSVNTSFICTFFWVKGYLVSSTRAINGGRFLTSSSPRSQSIVMVMTNP